MDALRINKIAAAVLSGVLLIMVFGKIGNILVDPKTDISNAYPIEVPEKNQIKSKVVEEVVIEPILALLATANLESGQKISKKCVACHGFDSGGPNKVESEEPGKSGMIHAEINALLKMDYNNPKKKKMYLNLSPCRACSKAIVNAGIDEVIFKNEYRDMSGVEILKSAGLKVRQF